VTTEIELGLAPASLCLGVLAVTTYGHVRDQASLASTIRRHARAAPQLRYFGQRAATVAAAVLALELTASITLVVSLVTSNPLVGAPLTTLAGFVFVGYATVIHRAGVAGDCGCTPFGTDIGSRTVLPGAVLLGGGVALIGVGAFDLSWVTRLDSTAHVGVLQVMLVVLGALWLLWEASDVPPHVHQQGRGA